MNLYIGKKMMLTPEVFIDKSGKLMNEKDYPCKVVYINRPHRFFTAEFEFPLGNIRESFKYTEEKDYPKHRK